MATHTDLNQMDFGSENSGQGSIENTIVQPTKMAPNSGPSIAGMPSFAQAFNQFLKTLKSPVSTQQEEKVQAILKANPQYEAIFTKQRISHQEQQHELVRQQQRERQQRQRLMQQLRQRLVHDNYVPQDNTMRLQEMLPNPSPTVADMQDPTPTLKQLPETLKSVASAQQQQDSAILQKTDQQLQERQLFLEQFPQQLQLCEQQLQLCQQQLKQMRIQQSIQQLERPLMLIEHHMTEHPTMRPRQVLPNLVPSIAGRQRYTVEQQIQQLIERAERRRMLIPTMRPRRVLPNVVPSIADRQRSTEEQQILETLKALNLK